MKNKIQTFNDLYFNNYPKTFGLDKYLRYYLIKYYLFKKIIQFIKESPKDDIYIGDIGGGYGYDCVMINNMLKIYNIKKNIYFDVIDQNIDFYSTVEHKTTKDINYIKKSFLSITKDITFGSKYDLILCSEVIEHLTTLEKEKFFSNFNYCLKMDGLLLISCPNGSSLLKNILGLYRGFRDNSTIFEDDFSHRFGHIGIPTIFETIGLFIRKGFKIEHIYPTSISSGTKYTLFSKILNYIMRIFYLINLFFSTALCFIGKKKKDIDHNKRYNKLD